MTLPVLLLSVYVCVCVCIHTHNSNTHTHKYTCVAHIYTHIPSKPKRPRLPLQSDRRFKIVSEANQTVSPHNCIDRISAEFGWQEGRTLTGSVKEPSMLLEQDPMLSHRVLAE